MLCYTNIQVFENNLKYSFLYKLWFLNQEAENRTKGQNMEMEKFAIIFQNI